MATLETRDTTGGRRASGHLASLGGNLGTTLLVGTVITSLLLLVKGLVSITLRILTEQVTEMGVHQLTGLVATETLAGLGVSELGWFDLLLDHHGAGEHFAEVLGELGSNVDTTDTHGLLDRGHTNLGILDGGGDLSAYATQFKAFDLWFTYKKNNDMEQNGKCRRWKLGGSAGWGRGARLICGYWPPSATFLLGGGKTQEVHFAGERLMGVRKDASQNRWEKAMSMLATFMAFSFWP